MNRICKTCNLEQDLHSGFYANTSGYDTTCKECRKKQQMERRKKRESIYPTGNPHEAAFIEACKAQGIHAQPTAEFRHYKFSDVIAWGCVRIEVKYPQVYGDNNTHKWVFSQKQARERIPVDLIVLISEFSGVTSYHIFDPLHPVFFSKNKQRRLTLTYTQESGINHAYYKVRYGVSSLTDDIMRTHQDNWYLIETMRLDKSRILKRQAQPAHTATEGKAA